jgi:hypothetical protein
VSLCAILHDVDDWKYCSISADRCQKRSITFLKALHADQRIVDTVALVLDRIGFKESLRSIPTPHGDSTVTCDATEDDTTDTALQVLHVVQDADRLDAIGKTLPISIQASTRIKIRYYNQPAS